MGLKRLARDIIAAGFVVMFRGKIARVLCDPRYFRWWERRGFHITPNHFYYPIPDTRTLKDEIWLKHTELAGINMNEEGQLDLLAQFASEFKDEYESFPRGKTSVPHHFYDRNPLFGGVDAAILYCMIRRFKPRRIIEVGSGNTTYLSAQAVLRNREDGAECELIAIDPHPNKVLKAGFPGLSRLEPKAVQDVPLSEFEKLTNNDILLIDSSHVLKIAGDVQYEFLEIVPRLSKGAIVHFHDIFLPAEYPKEWVLERRLFWTEQYLLQAFLAFNHVFEVLWASSYMHLKHPDQLKAALRSYKRDGGWPASFWIRKTK